MRRKSDLRIVLVEFDSCLFTCMETSNPPTPLLFFQLELYCNCDYCRIQPLEINMLLSGDGPLVGPTIEYAKLALGTGITLL